jgi:hypothetical protein
MKKILFSMAIVAISFSAAKAQYFGIKGGLNFSKINVENEFNLNDFNDKYLTGLHVGGYVNLKLSEKLSFQPELMYASKGTKIDYELLGEPEEIKLRLDYLEIPFLAVYNIGSMIQLQAGPYIAFLLNADYTDNSDEASIDKGDFESFDFGLSGGVAFNFSALQVGGRYNYGIPDIAKSEQAQMAFGDANNGSFQLYAALRFGSYD